VLTPDTEQTVERLRAYLTRMAAQTPDCWRILDAARDCRGRELPSWPAWCFIPSGAVWAAVSAVHGDIDRSTAGALAGLAAWRTAQGIYRFDPTMLQALWDTPITGDLPGEVLLRLPEWCCYIETPGAIFRGRESYGFFVSIDWDARSYADGVAETPWLRFHVDYGEVLDVSLPLPIVGTVEEGLRAWLTAAREASGGAALPDVDFSAKFAAELAPMISLTLYLCSQHADILRHDGDSAAPHYPRPKITKHGPRWFPPDHPAAWDVGWRIGAAIRAAEESAAHRERGPGSTHASPRPHIRTAHWHSFWTGPKAKPGVAAETERKLILHWLPPIPVNVAEELAVVPTIHAVG
jgi:hypothetical protein